MKYKNLVSFIIIIVVILIACVVVYNDQDLWMKIDANWDYDYPEKFEYAVEYIEEKEDSYIIRGWAFVHNEDLYTIDMAVILYDEQEDFYYKIKTDINNLGDITDFFNEGIDYDNARFLARVKKEHLKEGHNYKVNLLYKNNGYNFLVEMDRSVMKDGQ